MPKKSLRSATFASKTQKIESILQNDGAGVVKLENLFMGRVKIYIDYANVRPWADKLKWHIDLKRLKQFLDSFDSVVETRLYMGTLVGDHDSEVRIDEARNLGFVVVTKPVKRMRQSIDTTSINQSSPELLSKFIRKALLGSLDIQTVKYLNGQLTALNTRGIYFIEDKKCNFDVEIGVDMLLDLERDSADTFVLWSGDSDFADPIERIIAQSKRAVLFATPRVVSRELNAQVQKGLFIFDIQRIKRFICWNRELSTPHFQRLQIGKTQKGPHGGP